MVEYAIQVDGMVCSNCERVLGDALAEVDGVTRVTADADADRMTVESDPGSLTTVRNRIEDLGFEVVDRPDLGP